MPHLSRPPVVWLLLPLLLAGSLVHAQQPTASEEAALQAYRQGAFSRAVALYTQALSETEDPAHRAQLHVRIAWTLFALGREDEVDTHLKAALLEEPNITLLSDYYTQEFVQLFEDARRQLAEGTHAAHGTPPPDLEATVSSIEQRLQSGGDLEGALADVDRLLAAYPRDGRLIPLRAELLRRMGRDEEAAQAMDVGGGLAVDGGAPAQLSIPELVLRANELLSQGDLETSLELLREAVARQPGNVAALELMAEAAGRAGRLQEAEFALKSALALQPDNIGLRLRLGEVFLATGELSAARDVFRQLTEQFPHSDRAWAALGLLDARLGRVDRALDELSRALQENPLLPEVQLAYGELLLKRGDVDEAVEALNAATNLLQDDPQVEARLGQAKLARQRWTDALAHLRTAVDGGFAPADVRRSLVLALVQQGRLAEAEQELSSLDVDHASTRALAALIDFRAGRHAAAEAVLEPLAEQSPTDATILTLLAASLYEQGRYREALPYLERVMELHPDDATVATNHIHAAAARAAVVMADQARPIAHPFLPD